MKAEDWIKVEERLPEDLEKVLVFCEDNWATKTFRHVTTGCYIAAQKGWCVELNSDDITVTHWMSIELPKEEKK